MAGLLVFPAHLCSSCGLCFRVTIGRVRILRRSPSCWYHTEEQLGRAQYHSTFCVFLFCFCFSHLFYFLSKLQARGASKLSARGCAPRGDARRLSVAKMTSVTKKISVTRLKKCHRLPLAQFGAAAATPRGSPAVVLAAAAGDRVLRPLGWCCWGRHLLPRWDSLCCLSQTGRACWRRAGRCHEQAAGTICSWGIRALGWKGASATPAPQ